MHSELSPEAMSAGRARNRVQDRQRGVSSLEQECHSINGVLPDVPREDRLDAARRRDVLLRQQLAMTDRLQLLQEQESRGAPDPRPTVLVLHRQPWFCDKVATEAHRLGLRVVACVDNGADGVGIAVAEQPDVVVLDEHVAMITSLSAIQQLRTYCPATRVLVQVQSPQAREHFLDAGAAEVLTRAVPPADVAAAVLVLAGLDAVYPG